MKQISACGLNRQIGYWPCESHVIENVTMAHFIDVITGITYGSFLKVDLTDGHRQRSELGIKI